MYISLVDDQLRKPDRPRRLSASCCALTGTSVSSGIRSVRQVRRWLSQNYTYESLPPDAQELMPGPSDVLEGLEAPVEVEGRQLTIDEFIAELQRDQGGTQSWR